MPLPTHRWIPGNCCCDGDGGGECIECAGMTSVTIDWPPGDSSTTLPDSGVYPVEGGGFRQLNGFVTYTYPDGSTIDGVFYVSVSQCEDLDGNCIYSLTLPGLFWYATYLATSLPGTFVKYQSSGEPAFGSTNFPETISAT